MKKLSIVISICLLLNFVVLLIHAQDSEFTATYLVEQSNATLGIAISPDGSKLIVGNGPVIMEGRDGQGYPPDQNKITVYDFETGEMLQQFDSTAVFVADLALSPDGSQIVAALSPNTVGILDIETGEVLRQYEGIASAVLDVSSDGQLVISNARAAQATLWNFETGEVIQQFEETTGSFGPVAFSPDSKIVAVVSATSTTETSNVLILWDIESNSEIYRLEDLPLIPDIEFSPDGELLALATLGNGIRVISAVTGDTAYEFNDYQAADDTISNDAGAVAFSADGEQLVSAWYTSDVVLWDIATGTYTYVGSHDNAVWRVIFSPDGHPVTSSYDGRVMIWISNE